MNTLHGRIRRRLYAAWFNMKIRCTDPSHDSWKYYGAKGIRVCEEWARDFGVFCDWALAMGYSDDKSIDRIDNDKDYAPQNCRLATREQQARNRGKAANCTSRYKGVSWRPDVRKWVCHVNCRGLPSHVGFFDDEREAARAYNTVAAERFGEFVHLNVID